ncbi:RHS repeat-associated core domain-containing protein [Streptomyces sp. NPDC056353]
MGHRYYDPTLGRFTQPDPSGQETNPYLYAGVTPSTRPILAGLDSWTLSARRRRHYRCRSSRRGRYSGAVG